jgi:GntR family transcriptional regulator
VTSGQEDLGVGQIIAAELTQALNIPIQTIALENLVDTLDQINQSQINQEQPILASTIVTNRYFAEMVHKILGDRPMRVFTIDIYNYSQEIARIRQLPQGSSVGLVSVSTGVLRLAESLIQSIRKDVLVISVLAQDTYRLQSMLKTVDLVITGHSAQVVKQAMANSDRIRPLEVMYSGNYISGESIRLLKLELGIS